MTLEWFYVYMYIFVSSSFSTLCCYDSFPSVAKILSQSNIPTVTFYNKLVVLYCLFSSLLKWLLTFFSCLYSFWCQIWVPCRGFKIWRPFNRYLLYQTVFYCVVFYFSVLQSVFVSDDARPDLVWIRRIISDLLSTWGQFSHHTTWDVHVHVFCDLFWYPLWACFCYFLLLCVLWKRNIS